MNLSVLQVLLLALTPCKLLHPLKQGEAPQGKQSLTVWLKKNLMGHPVHCENLTPAIYEQFKGEDISADKVSDTYYIPKYSGTVKLPGENLPGVIAKSL